MKNARTAAHITSYSTEIPNNLLKYKGQIYVLNYVNGIIIINVYYVTADDTSTKSPEEPSFSISTAAHGQLTQEYKSERFHSIE